MTELQITVDDLSSAATRALVSFHLAGMHENSPPESVHALGLESLTGADVTVWSARSDDEVAGIAALKRLDPARGELKSMRVDDRFLGRGVGRMLLRHLMAEARAGGIQSLWLETGSAPEFVPAQRLYESEGFERCPPFPPYVADPFSVFMTRTL